MALIRTTEEATRDLEAFKACCEELNTKYGLNEHWAGAVYYDKMPIAEAVKAQAKEETLIEMLEDTAEDTEEFITSFEDFMDVVNSLESLK